jgi:hypothetical protein
MAMAMKGINREEYKKSTTKEEKYKSQQMTTDRYDLTGRRRFRFRLLLMMLLLLMMMMMMLPFYCITPPLFRFSQFISTSSTFQFPIGILLPTFFFFSSSVRQSPCQKFL